MDIEVIVGSPIVIEVAVPGVQGPPGPSGSSASNRNRRVVTATGNILTTDQIILYAGSTDIILTLPSAVDDLEFTFKQTGTGKITLATEAGEFIEGAATAVLTQQNESVDIFTFGGAYYA